MLERKYCKFYFSTFLLLSLIFSLSPSDSFAGDELIIKSPKIEFDPDDCTYDDYNYEDSDGNKCIFTDKLTYDLDLLVMEDGTTLQIIKTGPSDTFTCNFKKIIIGKNIELVIRRIGPDYHIGHNGAIVPKDLRAENSAKGIDGSGLNVTINCEVLNVGEADSTEDRFKIMVVANHGQDGFDNTMSKGGDGGDCRLVINATEGKRKLKDIEKYNVTLGDKELTSGNCAILLVAGRGSIRCGEHGKDGCVFYPEF